MRLATFNILNARRPSDEHVDLDGLRAAVASLDADVLALQEVDHNQDRSHSADLTAVAAEAMGAVDQRFVAAMTGNPGATWVAATGEEQPDAAAYGIALLSRFPVASWHLVRLPVLHAPTPMRFSGHLLPTLVRDEPRVGVAAVVEAPGGRVSVATTHLSFIPWWNGHQLGHLVHSLADVPRPLLLTGDLNMGPRRAARITGMKPLVTAETFPAEAPREQLDHVLLDGDLRAVGCAAREMPVSDHRALVVDLA